MRRLVLVVFSFMCLFGTSSTSNAEFMYFGETSDATGDSFSSMGDIAYASIGIDAHNYIFNVAFAPGTFDLNTLFQFNIDLDQDTSTGTSQYPFTGTDHIVTYYPHISGVYLQVYNDGPWDLLNTFTSISFFANGAEIIIPKSYFGDDGLLDFKLASQYTVDLGTGSYSGILDYAPDIHFTSTTATVPVPAAAWLLGSGLLGLLGIRRKMQN